MNTFKRLFTQPKTDMVKPIFNRPMAEEIAGRVPTLALRDKAESNQVEQLGAGFVSDYSTHLGQNLDFDHLKGESRPPLETSTKREDLNEDQRSDLPQ